MRSILILPAGRGATVVASSVRFLRIGVRLCVFLTGGIGIDFETFIGPFASVAHFAQYLLPLAGLLRFMSIATRGGGGARSLVAAARTALAETDLDLALDLRSILVLLAGRGQR
jgi:hypothetical protein